MKTLIITFLSIFLFSYSFGQFQIDDSLYAYYPFNTNALDESGNNIHGTVNGATLISDRNGLPLSAYSFDGVDDYIDLNEDFDFIEKTISFWFYARSIGPTAKVIWDSDHPNLQNGYVKIRVIESFGNKLRVSVGDVANIQEVPINLNEWYMITVTSDGNITRYYLDGQLFFSNNYIQDSPDPVGHQSVALGTTRIFDRHFDGIIDEVRVYTRALSESDVDSLFIQTISNIDDFDANKINVFPNPSSDYLILEVHEFKNYSEMTLRLSGRNGEIFFEKNVNSSKSKINLTDLSSGVYYLRLITAERTYTRKLLID